MAGVGFGVFATFVVTFFTGLLVLARFAGVFVVLVFSCVLVVGCQRHPPVPAARPCPRLSRIVFVRFVRVRDGVAGILLVLIPFIDRFVFFLPGVASALRTGARTAMPWRRFRFAPRPLRPRRGLRILCVVLTRAALPHLLARVLLVHGPARVARTVTCIVVSPRVTPSLRVPTLARPRDALRPVLLLQALRPRVPVTFAFQAGAIGPVRTISAGTVGTLLLTVLPPLLLPAIGLVSRARCVGAALIATRCLARFCRLIRRARPGPFVPGISPWAVVPLALRPRAVAVFARSSSAFLPLVVAVVTEPE
jgi:hypothetical protein